MIRPYLNSASGYYQKNSVFLNKVAIGAVVIAVLWIIYRNIFAKAPQKGIDPYKDPKGGINNSGLGGKNPFVNGGKVNYEYFRNLNELYAFLNKDGAIDDVDAAHQIQYAYWKNQQDYAINGCDEISNELCTQLDNLMQQSDDFVKMVNRAHLRIYGNYIQDILPSFYNVLTCKCPNNSAYKERLSRLN